MANKTISNEKIIAELISCDTRLEACKKLNITPDTLYKRMKEEEFQKQYKEANDLLYFGVVEKIRSKMLDAIEMITLIMNESTNDQTRLNASIALLNHGEKLKEQTDFAKRLEALENLNNDC